ncbi:hypothetical protein ACWOD8_02025 [Enterococcus plantarum]|nr:hypothetical protein [Enterococcus plantarum]
MKKPTDFRWFFCSKIAEQEVGGMDASVKKEKQVSSFSPLSF